MTEPDPPGDPLTAEAGPFRLDFVRTANGDRWAHELSVNGARFVRTLEADYSRDRPEAVASPVYQEIAPFSHDAGRFLFQGVGLSGPHYFAASFDLATEQGVPRLQVSVSDRMPGSTPLLACTYVVDLRSGDLIDADDRRIVWGLEAGRLVLTAEDVGEQTVRLSLGESGRSAARVQIFAEPLAGAPHQRCQYVWSWEPARSSRIDSP